MSKEAQATFDQVSGMVSGMGNRRKVGVRCVRV